MKISIYFQDVDVTVIEENPVYGSVSSKTLFCNFVYEAI